MSEIEWVWPLQQYEGDYELNQWLASVRDGDPVYLNFSRTHVTDRGVKAVVAARQQLQGVDFYLTGVGNEAVKALANCHHLKVLKLGNTHVGDEGVKALAAHPLLREVDLSHTRVGKEGMKALATCLQLREVNLTHTRLEDDEVKDLVARHQLEVLQLSFTWVTDEGVKAVAACPQLRKLDLTITQVTDEGVADLATCHLLESLVLNNTRVTNTGLMALANLTSLRLLKIANTSTTLPATVTYSDDAQAIFKYLRNAWAGKPLLEVKVCVLGQGRQGKTQFCRWLTAEPGTNPFDRTIDRTHAFEQYKVKRRIRVGDTDHDCLLRVFDFGGQPEMHGTHRFFLADGRNVYVVLVSARKTAEENRLWYWLNMVREYGGGAPVVVIISHCDAEPGDDGIPYHRPKKQRLEPLDAETLSDKFECPIRVVDDYSNVTGHSITKVKAVLDEAAGRVKNVFDQLFSNDIFAVHAWLDGNPPSKLKNQRGFDTYCPVDTFRRVCTAAGEDDPKQQNFWLNILNDLGLLHYVGDRKDVKINNPHGIGDFVFRPDWVKWPVYDVVTSNEAYERNGLLRSEQVHDILRKREVTEVIDRDQLIALMEACELVFRRGPHHFLIVDRIPPALRGWVRGGWPNPPFRCILRTFSFLPEHLLPQLLGRWFDRHDGDYFRDDVVFWAENRTCRVRLTADMNAGTVAVEFAAHDLRPTADLLIALDAEMRNILDPHNRGGRLWTEVDSDVPGPPKFSHEDGTLISKLAKVMDELTEREVDTTALMAALEHGFTVSAGCDRKSPRSAYRVCWVYACWMAVCHPNSREVRTIQPIPEGREAAKLVEVWLTAKPKIKRLFKLETWNDIAGNLRKNYTQAMADLLAAGRSLRYDLPGGVRPA